MECIACPHLSKMRKGVRLVLCALEARRGNAVMAEISLQDGGMKPLFDAIAGMNDDVIDALLGVLNEGKGKNETDDQRRG